MMHCAASPLPLHRIQAPQLAGPLARELAVHRPSRSSLVLSPLGTIDFVAIGSTRNRRGRLAQARDRTSAASSTSNGSSPRRAEAVQKMRSSSSIRLMASQSRSVASSLVLDEWRRSITASMIDRKAESSVTRSTIPGGFARTPACRASGATLQPRGGHGFQSGRPSTTGRKNPSPAYRRLCLREAWPTQSGVLKVRFMPREPPVGRPAIRPEAARARRPDPGMSGCGGRAQS